MKQIFLILSIVPFLFGCVQTREQRGAEIAKSEMMKRLYDADSYEPIETHIDSAYTSIYTDLAVIRAAHDLIELNAEEKKERLQRQYNSAKSSAAIWSDSRGWSSYAKEEMDDYANQLKELDEEVKVKMNEIQDHANVVSEHQFCGWNIYHRFRYANRLGMQQISDVLIIVDENMEYVNGCFILDDGDDYSLEKFKKVIDKAIGKNRK